MKKIIATWTKDHQIHLIVWSLFISYEIIVIGIIFKNFGNPVTYLFHYTIIISFFYFHSDLALPWALKYKEYVWWRLPAEVVLALTAYIILHFYADEILIYTHLMPIAHQKFDYQFVLRNLYRGIYFIGFSTGYFYLKNHIKTNKEKEKLKEQYLNNIIKQQKTDQELSKARNAFLRAQINPHFLFNTLDFIYHNINKHSEKASEAIIMLSRMMRYAVDSDETEESVILEEELVQAKNLLYLYQLRKSNELAIKINYTPEVLQIRIIPFLLLTLIENVIKHGDLNSARNMAVINVFIEKQTFFIETDNLIAKVKINTGTQNGLKNIEMRTRYAYGSKAIFNYYTDHRDHFIVKLSIPLEVINKRDATADILKGDDIQPPHEYVGRQ